MELRGTTKELLGWLRSNPSEVDRGWEVLNLLLWSHGNYNYVSIALMIHTGKPWSVRDVKKTVEKIKGTRRGLALCQALGIDQGGL